jgi:hypothetical protein
MFPSHLRNTPSFLALIVFGIVATVGPAYAIPTLVLTDSTTGNSVTVVDEGAEDTFQGEVGAVGFNGTVGVWNVYTSSAYVMGSSESPWLNMNSTVRSSQASSLTVAFSADGFGPSAGVLDVAVSGNLARKGTAGNSTISFTTLWSPSDVLFAGGLLANFGTANSTTSSLAVSDNQTLSFAGAVTYSLTEIIVISHGAGSRQSNFDAAIEVTDVPSVPDHAATPLLLGLGLLSLGLAGRAKLGRGAGR